MIVVDANVLVYASNQDAAHHAVSRRWLDEALSGQETVGFSWIVLLAYIRLTTNPRIFPAPLSTAEAFAQVERWLDTPSATILSPTPRHLGVLAGLLNDHTTAANLVNDAHLAALAVEHGATVASFDRDFGRFAGVRTAVPGTPPRR